MYLKSYAVLLPCGISLFTGVEFVCCPEDKKIDYNSEDYEDEDEDEDEDEEEDEEYEFDRSTSTTTTTTPKPTQDPYFQTFNVLNEHQNYIEAKERLVKAHKARINSIMSDWNKLEERYQAMRGNDPGGAEEFKRAVTMRFQKTVKALEEESLAEKKQLISIHGQRILSHLNEKKRESMECFTKSLNERPQVSRRIRKCMEKLMKYLNKDRHHTVLYFKNNPGNQDIMEYTLDRLEQIGATVKEAFNMLGRYPHLSSELKPLVEDYILSLQGMDGLKFNILTATREVDSVLLNSLIGKTTAATSTTEQTTQPATQQPTTQTTTQQPTTEEEEEPKYYRANDYVANLAKRDELHREATFTVRREVYYANDSKNVYLIMAFAGFALFGTLVIGMVVLRRRNSPKNQGFLEVNTLASGAPCGEDIKSPEEKHVVNMQINGYENPTYKYFEVGTIIK
jgi:amyloid beta A4 protein